jgi:hypothetical protein
LLYAISILLNIPHLFNFCFLFVNLLISWRNFDMKPPWAVFYICSDSVWPLRGPFGAIKCTRIEDQRQRYVRGNVWWTSPSFRFAAGSLPEFDRLLNNKPGFTLLTLTLIIFWGRF